MHADIDRQTQCAEFGHTKLEMDKWSNEVASFWSTHIAS